MTATKITASGTTSIVHAGPTKDPKIDCFYVYPTVSGQTTENANLDIEPEEIAIARQQASLFSQECRVFAPMYPQLTLAAVNGPSGLNRIPPSAADKAYAGVLEAWKYYLAHYNHGRGFVLIGHSQGTTMLIALMKHRIDPNPAVRNHLVSALLLGGNVHVGTGTGIGGSFQNIPACVSSAQAGCVVAYSSFDKPPPPGANLAFVTSGLNAVSGAAAQNLQVLCVSPAALTGAGDELTPYFLTSTFPGVLGKESPPAPKATTPWVTYPGLYTGTCESSGAANWLQVNVRTQAGDTRSVITQTLGDAWGLHLYDFNIDLGNLVTLVHNEAAGYSRH
jgi:pimeloyl-ACP methyl ester carboxylesterase